MEKRDVELLQGILRIAAAGGGGGAVLILGSLLLDVEQLKREVHKIEIHTVMPEGRRNGPTR